MPTVKGLRMWLTHELGYRVKGDRVELAGGYRLRIIGWDRRYDDFPNREARLVFREGRVHPLRGQACAKASKVRP